MKVLIVDWRCTESGTWSHQLPFCKRACSFPTVPEVSLLHDDDDDMNQNVLQDKIPGWDRVPDQVPVQRGRPDQPWVQTRTACRWVDIGRVQFKGGVDDKSANLCWLQGVVGLQQQQRHQHKRQRQQHQQQIGQGEWTRKPPSSIVVVADISQNPTQRWIICTHTVRGVINDWLLLFFWKTTKLEHFPARWYLYHHSWSYHDDWDGS